MAKTPKTYQDTAQVKPPSPRTHPQKELLNAIKQYDMVIASGPAGTGKTYCTAGLAAYLLASKQIKKIVLTRPVVPTGKSIGYFPGELEDKMAPWVVPFTSVLKQFLGQGAFDCHVKNGNIEVVPFETIRGRSFEDSFVILDEAQNTTVSEIKAFLTRHGEGSKTIILGDKTQTDIKECNGLDFTIYHIEHNQRLTDNVGYVQFTKSDIVRSGLCKMWVEAFES